MHKVKAIVTGGASGLGKAAVQALSKSGASVVIADLQKPKWISLWNKDLEREAVHFSKCNVCLEDEVRIALDLCKLKFGGVNTAVNCAGVAFAAKTFSDRKGPHPLDVFEKTINVNVTGTFNVVRLAAEAIAKEDPEDGMRGVIVNTASIAAFEGQIGQVAYAASKGAIVGMTLPAARDLAVLGIRVNTIAPGLFDTPLLAGLPEKVKTELGMGVPCPSRLGHVYEFGALAKHLVENKMINGETIRIDGALRMQP